MTPEEKQERIKAQKLEWYNRNKNETNRRRREKYNTDTKKAVVKKEVPLKVKSSALNQSKYLQETQNFRTYTYAEWQANEGFRPQAERFAPKSGIYRVKYNECQQLPSQKNLNAVPVHEPIADKLFRPTGLRSTIKGPGMPWSSKSTFAHDYVWRNK